VELAPEAMPPTDGPGFCRYAAAVDAPALFGPARPAPGLVAQAAGGGGVGSPAG